MEKQIKKIWKQLNIFKKCFKLAQKRGEQMKLTDFALIFIGVTLPIIIIVYVNVSFTIKAQEQFL